MTALLLVVLGLAFAYWLGWNDRKMGEQEEAMMRGLDELCRKWGRRP